VNPEQKKPVLDISMRREIAAHLYRIFCLIASHIAFTIDENGITIRIPFSEPHDLGGPNHIHGIAKGIHEYSEETMTLRT
jgi:hypothetical protein